MRKIIQLLILIFIIFSISRTNAKISETFSPKSFCLPKMELTPTLHDSRQQPLFSRAVYVINNLTGGTYFEGFDPQVIYCLLSFQDRSIQLTTKITSQNIRNILNIKKDELITYSHLVILNKKLHIEYLSIKNESIFKKELKNLIDKINLYQDLISGNDWMYPVLNNKQISYSPVSQLLKTHSKDFFNHENLLDVILLHNKDHGNRLNLELKYIQIHPESYALILALIAFVSVILFARFEIALAFTCATIGLQFISIASRLYLTNLSSFSRAYDITLYIALALLLVAMVLGHIKNNKKIVLIGLSVNFVIIILSLFFGRMI